MANKQEMKKSEARILLFLSQTDMTLHYLGKISVKLEIDYGYTIRILAEMVEKDWLRRDKGLANPQKTFYHLTKDGLAMLQMAKTLLTIQV